MTLVTKALPLPIISIPTLVGLTALVTACGSGAINATNGSAGDTGNSGEGGESGSSVSGSGGSSSAGKSGGGQGGQSGKGGKGGSGGKAGSSSQGGAGSGNANAGGEAGEGSSSGGTSSAGTSSSGGVPSCGAPATGSGGSGGPEGEWVEIDAPIEYDECGPQTMLRDPARPSDFYALVCERSSAAATLKSTDFGQTFERVDEVGFNGSPTGGAIDPNPCRDPSTPPTMYAPAFAGELGLFKSVDGGVNWRQMIPEERGSVPGLECSDYWPPDFYSVAIVPDNPPNHILVTYHIGAWNCGSGGFAESLDGGETFIEHRGPSGWGSSDYAVIVDAQTWLIVNEGDGLWRTTTAGRVNGEVSPDAWERVSEIGHTHGSFQGLVLADSTIYIPGSGGIHKSTDRGATFDNVYDTGGNYMDSVIATDRFLYANSFYYPTMQRAPRDSDDDWTEYHQVPSGMTTGPAPHGAASTFDGTNWILMTANDRGGLWRYVEPAQ
jgi:hypothetical protein